MLVGLITVLRVLMSVSSGSSARKVAYRDSVAESLSSASVSVCPFDGLFCEHVDCCDDLLGVAVEHSCSRAKRKR